MHLAFIALDRLYNGIEATQFEDDGVTLVAISIGCLLDAVALTDHLPFKTKAVRCLTEEEQALASCGMLSDSAISALKLHGAYLALPEIFEDAIVSIAILVSVLQPLLRQ